MVISQEIKVIKLPCGCVLGSYLCPEAVKLIQATNEAFSQALNAPKSDFGWKKYEDVQLKYYDHLKIKEATSESTKETI